MKPQRGYAKPIVPDRSEHYLPNLFRIAPETPHQFGLEADVTRFAFGTLVVHSFIEQENEDIKQKCYCPTPHLADLKRQPPIVSFFCTCLLLYVYEHVVLILFSFREK